MRDRLLELPLRFKIASIGVLVLLLMMGANAISAAGTARRLVALQEQQQAQASDEQLDHLMLAFANMETSVRGYVISRDPSFLKPYDEGVAEFPVILDRLEGMIDQNSEQRARLNQLRSLANRWNSETLAAEIEATASGGNAHGLVDSERGKALMDRIRLLIEEIREEEERGAAALAEASQRYATYAQVGTWGVAGAAAILSLYLSYVLAGSLTQPIQRLVEATRAVSNGSMGLEVPLVPMDELGLLTAGFNQMSRALKTQEERNSAQAELLLAQQEELAAHNEELQAQQHSLSVAMEQLADDRDRLARLNEFTRLMVGSPDMADLTGRLLRELMRAGRANVGAVALLSPGAGMTIAAQSGLTPEAGAATEVAGLFLEAATTGQPVWADYPKGALLRPVYHTQLPVEHELYLPIRYGDETLAVAVLGRTGPNPFDEHTTNWLQLMAAQSAAAVSTRLAYEKLKTAYADLQESAAHVEELSTLIEAERDLATEQRDSLRAVMHSTSEGIVMVDHTGKFVMINPQFWNLMGMEPNPKLTLDDLRAFLRKRARNWEEAHRFLDLMWNDPTFTGVGNIELLDPTRIIRRYTAPVHGAGGRLLGRLLVYRDVTRETEIDRMKTEFISTVSHELRTPLTSIRGYVDLILDGDAGPISAEQREYLELVSKSTTRLSHLINDLLDAERIEQGRIEMRHEAVDLEAILGEVTRTLAIAAEAKHLSLDLRVTGPLPPVTGDPDRLTQVFTNLVSNGIKYTRSGGVLLSATVEGSWITVSVTDTGIGISEEHLPQLFDKFFRVDNQYTREVGGTGLGLSIARAIVQQHGGQITVQSALGKGSTFTVSLPVSLPVAEQKPQHAGEPVPEVTPGDGRLVLIIEDDESIARLIAQHVIRRGLRAAVAANGSDGLTLAESLKPDLITLDVLLPGMDGWEVITRLRQNPVTQAIPVLFLSIVEDAKKGYQLGADAYLTKPIQPALLHATLDRLLNPGETAVLLAVPDAEPDLRRLITEMGCRPVQADRGRTLASQVAATGAGLVVLSEEWNGRPIKEAIASLRGTRGLERLPVVVLGKGSGELDTVPEVLGPKGDEGVETVAKEIIRHVTQPPDSTGGPGCGA